MQRIGNGKERTEQNTSMNAMLAIARLVVKLLSAGRPAGGAVAGADAEARMWAAGRLVTNCRSINSGRPATDLSLALLALCSRRW